MGLRVRLKSLKGYTFQGRHVLVCPECKEEFVIYGDAAMDLLVADWIEGAQAGGAKGQTPPEVLRAMEHEHSPFGFLEKKSGRPFFSKGVSGMEISEAWGAQDPPKSV